MENASKALLIAGGVLIAILVLSIGVYLVSNLSKASDSYVSSLDTTEIIKYNSNFTIYIGRNDITIQEIITALGIAHQAQRGTRVFIGNIDYTQELERIEEKYTDTKERKRETTELLNNLLKNNISIQTDDGFTNTYRCEKTEDEDYDSNGIIKKIVFYKN